MRGFKSSANKSSSEKPIGENMSSTPIAQPSHSSSAASSSSSSASSGHVSASAVSVAAPISSAAKPSLPTAIIGPKIRFKGELVGEEDLLIQGQVDGTIDLKNNTLTIGEQGVVKANVVANTVTIEGTIEGDVYGQERISILASSNVKGNIVADRVTLEDGAKFRGSIDMDIEPHKDKFQNISANTSATARSPQAATDSTTKPTESEK